MADKKFTLLELHMHGDAEFGPERILSPGRTSNSGGEEESEDDEEDAVEVDAGGGGIGGVVLALIVLAVVGIAVKKFLGGDEEPGVDFEE